MAGWGYGDNHEMTKTRLPGLGMGRIGDKGEVGGEAGFGSDFCPGKSEGRKGGCGQVVHGMVHHRNSGPRKPFFYETMLALLDSWCVRHIGFFGCKVGFDGFPGVRKPAIET